MFSSYSMKPDFTCVERRGEKKILNSISSPRSNSKSENFRDFQDPFARMWFLVAHFFYTHSSLPHHEFIGALDECRVFKLHVARAIRSTFIRTSFIIVSLVYGRFSTVNWYYAKPYCTSIIPEMWLRLALFLECSSIRPTSPSIVSSEGF